MDNFQCFIPFLLQMLSDRSKHQPLSIPFGGQINLGKKFIIFMSFQILQIIECCVAYSVGSSEPIKLSHNHFEHHKAAFSDILVNSHQLKLESKPIGEGTVRVKTIPLYNCKGCAF